MNNNRSITFAEAINESLREEMFRDKNIIIMGEDIALFGGRREVTKDLLRQFGPERVVDTPINEELFISIAIGAAQVGLRPVIELGHSTFIILDLVNVRRLGIWDWISAGKVSVPVVIRVKWGSDGLGHELSSSPLSSIIDHMGISIVSPSTPRQAKGLLTASLRGSAPVIFLESGKLYKKRGIVSRSNYTLSLKKAEFRKRGNDISLIGYGHLTDLAEEASFILGEKGIDAEILDLVSLKPLDVSKITETVQKTGRVVILSEEPNVYNGFSAKLRSIILNVNQDVKIGFVGPPQVPLPFGISEQYIIPKAEDVVEAVKHIM